MKRNDYKVIFSTHGTGLDVEAITQDWLKTHPVKEAPTVTAPKPKHIQELQSKATDGATNQIDPIAEFNKIHTCHDVLVSNGFEQYRNGYLSPNSTSGIPSVYVMNECKDGVERIYSHGNNDLNDGYPHDAFDCMRLLNHGGDWKTALNWNPDITKANQKAFMKAKEAEIDSTDVDNFIRRAVEARAVCEVNVTPKPRNKLTPVNELTKQVFSVEWLVQGIIPKSCVGLIFGDPENCKSLWIQGMGFCIAAGIDYNGLPTTRTKVVNYVGEGVEGLQPRYKALEMYHGIENDWLFNSEEPAQFMNAEYTNGIIQDLLELGGVGLVVIDTLHRNFGDGDENSARDFGLFMNNIDRLRKTIGCAVLIIHHNGHGDKSRSRGSSSIRASLDIEYSVVKYDNTLTVTCEKSKNFKRPNPFSYQIKEIQIDAENTSVVLESCEFNNSNKPLLDSKSKKVFEALELAIERHGVEFNQADWVSTNFDKPQKMVCVNDFKKVFDETNTGLSVGAKRNYLSSGKRAIFKAKLAVESEGFMWILKPADYSDVDNFLNNVIAEYSAKNNLI